jgi:hypothetical protein
MRTAPPASPPLGERELVQLQSLLDAVPASLEPLDVSALDGFLVGVLLQPQAVPASRWLPHVVDLDARPAPAVLNLAPPPTPGPAPPTPSWSGRSRRAAGSTPGCSSSSPTRPGPR